MRRQAVNYAKATVVAAGCFARGQSPYVPEDEAQARVEQHCLGHATGEICPKYRFSDGKCSACGCPARARARRTGLGCPLRKW